jgi:hypothetical protein
MIRRLLVELAAGAACATGALLAVALLTTVAAHLT